MLYDKEVDRVIEIMLSHANPNAVRAGCLSREEILSMAFRVREASDPLWLHVFKCSPCLAEILEAQRQYEIPPDDEEEPAEE